MEKKLKDSIYTDEFGELPGITQVYIENSAKCLDYFFEYKDGRCTKQELIGRLSAIFNPR